MSFTDKLLDFGFGNIELWRSESMELVQLIIPAESAHDTVAALGEVGLLQFKDLNTEKSAFQRTYANQVKRCDEMARRLRFFHEQVEKAGMTITPNLRGIGKYDLDELEHKLEELEKEVVEMNANTERLERTFYELKELQVVLDTAGRFFDSAKMKVRPTAFEAFGGPTENPDAPLLETAQVPEKVSRVGFVAGTIPDDKINGFERLLFRATRGNMFLRQAAVGKVRDPISGETVSKHVFVIFFAGDRSKAKIMKICEAFGANRYPFPEDMARQREMASEVTARTRELQTTIDAGARHREAVMQTMSANLDEWTTLVRREKAVYHTLNKMNVDVTSKVLIAEAWVPGIAKADVQAALRHCAENSSTQLHVIMQAVPTADMPPTYFRTNKFTQAFQNIVESYGVARYREVNPTVLTLMTFPFLFAVMFGDWGHAIIMTAFAAFLIIKERVLGKQDLGDILSMLFGGRYVILLMGMYSFYTGLIYNEFFSMPTVIFGRTRFQCFNPDGSDIINPDTGLNLSEDHRIDPRDCLHTYGGVLMMPEGAAPYNFGMDPIWHGRKTELPYFNSVKMKMSILLGVVHMDFGILNSLFNNLYWKDRLSIVCEFIPQMIFLNFIFGYLCILMIIKWCSGKLTDLYHVMIYMFLSPGSPISENPDDILIPGQSGLQVFLLLIAFICVPWMLLPKPLILKKRHEALMAAKGRTVELTHNYGALADDEESRHRPHGSATAHSGDSHGGGGHGDHGHGDHFEFGEIMVHQMIHTIEFVLGCVSNTASYLRLWALSLAHSQLASVFYDRVLMMSIRYGPLAMVIGFFVFALATLGVLLVMESLSAFLHALRLHWVEYQNKFYKGDGYKFAPFSFEALKNTEVDA